jgi:uncharacterized protein YhhL (DUF1145 family)
MGLRFWMMVLLLLTTPYGPPLTLVSRIMLLVVLLEDEGFGGVRR